MIGFIALHKQITNWEWYKDPNTFRLFIHILLKSNYQKSRYMGHDVPKGSAIVGRKQMALDLGLSEQQIRTAMKKLLSTNEITSKATNKFSIVTVVKYNDYQDTGKKSTNDSTSIITNEQPTDNQRITNEQPHLNKLTSKQSNNKEKKVPKKYPTSLPKDFKPSESNIEYARINNLDLENVLETFIAKTTAEGKKYKCWQSGFKTYLINAKKWGDGKRTNISAQDELRKAMEATQ